VPRQGQGSATTWPLPAATRRVLHQQRNQSLDCTIAHTAASLAGPSTLTVLGPHQPILPSFQFQLIACLPHAWAWWSQGYKATHLLPPKHPCHGCDKPPPPLEIDDLVEWVARYSWTSSSNCHKVVSLSHVASEMGRPFH